MKKKKVIKKTPKNLRKKVLLPLHERFSDDCSRWRKLFLPTLDLPYTSISLPTFFSSYGIGTQLKSFADFEDADLHLSLLGRISFCTSLLFLRIRPLFLTWKLILCFTRASEWLNLRWSMMNRVSTHAILRGLFTESERTLSLVPVNVWRFRLLQDSEFSLSFVSILSAAKHTIPFLSAEILLFSFKIGISSLYLQRSAVFDFIYQWVIVGLPRNTSLLTLLSLLKICLRKEDIHWISIVNN